MNVAMMQPSFIPWQGYFELILKSDVFVILDDFQFSYQSYHQRNRLFVNKEQFDWYSVPVKKDVSFKSPLNQVKINEATSWREKMWKRIKANYSKAAYYSVIAPWIEAWLLEPAQTLSSQNTAFIKFVSELLDYRGEFRFSSQLSSTKVRSERVAELLHWCGAKTYFCARGSFNYMLEDKVFPLPDIAVILQNHQPVPYEQVGSKNDFIPYLSILDALMNIGPEHTRKCVLSGTGKWTSWNEMKLEALTELNDEK
ncbi:MAG: WbqC family protein [Syntrophomonas sp.]